MALPILNPIKVPDREIVFLAGVVKIDGGSGAPDTTNSITPGFTVTRTDVGDYTITPKHSYADCIGVWIQNMDAGAAANSSFPVVNTRSGSSITITFYGDAGVTQTAAEELADNDEFYILLAMRASNHSAPSDT